MQTELTLEAAKAIFDNWRANKKDNDRIPEYLWDLARKLTTQYKMSQIARCLGLSSEQCKRLINTKQAKQAPSTTNANDFVALFPVNNLHNIDHQNQNAILTIEIKQPNGKVITLEAHNQVAITTILNHIMQ